MSRKTGLWLIGAFGGVATTVAVGLSALRKSTMSPWGLVSCLPEFEKLGLLAWDDIVLGGHEIRSSSSWQEASQLSRGPQPAIDPAVTAGCRHDLEAFDAAIRPGILVNAGDAIAALSEPQHVAPVSHGRQAVDRVQHDLRTFQENCGCDQMVVINLASTEPQPPSDDFPAAWSEFEKLLDESDCRLTSSTLYAIAALDLGIPYVNFTPSPGNAPAAIDELARLRQTCHMGSDGKTGETFLKSVLAPAFARRHLDVMSWVGHNIFGNLDGRVLNDPSNKQTKVSSKNEMLAQIMGYQPQTHISIEYIRSMGDWKTAWDHVHFRGFLGTPMTLQFTWQGCDSILAAPLVLDLLRFTEFAQRRGETGLLTFLSSFFKTPLGTCEHDFARQFEDLVTWVSNADSGSD